MISELPGDVGPLDPGVNELFRTLTSEPTPAELADEQSALAMFRANISPPASQPTVPIATGPIPNGPIPTANPAPDRSRRAAAAPGRHGTRLFRRSGGWGIRLAAAVVIVIAIALASAAYTAVLPQPIQLLAHRVLGVIGVPSPHHSGHPARSSRGQHRSTPPQSGRSPGHPNPGGSAPAGTPSPRAHKSATPTASPSHSPSATGPAKLSASASSAEVTAGAKVVIDGQFTRSGIGVQGVTIQLIERFVGHPLWHLAGTAQTTTDGNVTVTVPAVTANAVFRLRDVGVAHSANVLVIVAPPVTATLTPGAAGLRDVLMVSTLYAHRGNVVQLDVLKSGIWTYLRERRLNAAGKTAFVLSGKRLQNLEVRVVLLATARHGSSISNTQTVPPTS
ncbi:MAG TPA: hypothetical protein VME44_13535 [Streptosporangiaceae bacterium]|nr:hypothetical protein [Streptosporangiaceae bacterium]